MAGAGYKLFNTGDVLTAAQVNTYLQEQTVMVFADAAARTTALSGVLAEGMFTYLKDTDVLQYYSGASWVTVNTDQTPLTTKGDLFTYSTADARLAVGNNGENLVADSTATTGLRWQGNAYAGKNQVINGGMEIWQRGTSFSIAASTSASATTFSADRWQTQTNANQAITISRQATSDSTNLPNIQYCLRYQRNSGQTGTGALSLAQSFESATSIPFAGKTVTLSFYARAGANYSASSSALGVTLYSGTGTDQNIYSTYTGSATPISQTATLTTTWQRFSYSTTVATTTTELAVAFSFTPVGTASTNDYYEVTGIQLELGSVASSFARAGGTIAQELASCQRYFWQIKQDGSANTANICFGNAYATTNSYSIVALPVQMRVAPSVTFGTAGNYSVTNGSGGGVTCTAVSASSAQLNMVTLYGTVASGLTVGQGSAFQINGSSSESIKFSSEV